MAEWTDLAQTEADKAFWKFHGDNPAIYREIVSLAQQAYDRGRKRIGMQMLFEVIRWHRNIETNDKLFKLNNSHTSRYTRLLMQDYPELGKMFNTRSIRS